jgi:putative addiction module killer protein
VGVLEYLNRDGRSPYAQWFTTLNPQAAAKVAIAVTQMSQGNLSNSRVLGSACSTTGSTLGQGTEIYFGKDGECVVILLGGGSKKRQQRDIQDAIAKWHDYKLRKKKGVK